MNIFAAEPSNFVMQSLIAAVPTCRPQLKILRAAHLGMCFGVRDAIALALEQSNRQPLTILGELVHNESVLSDLRVRGVALEVNAADVTGLQKGPLSGRELMVCESSMQLARWFRWPIARFEIWSGRATIRWSLARPDTWRCVA